MEPSAREGDGDPNTALREAAPDGDDAVARRARALIEARLFGGPAPEAEGPEVFGRYRIEAKIGAGGMGVVYRAHDPELDRRVAVKLLRAEAADDERARQRMLREARAMARLAHPNVIHVYDVGAVDDQVFVAMELVDGVSLARWLMREERGWEEVLAVFRAAGEGLQAAHDAGLIHRDFKPENVLVGADGRVRVLDFGLARSSSGGGEAGTLEGGEVDEGAGAGAGAATTGGDLGGSLTRTGALMGTPRYMSPEVCRGRPADARSDLFGFCVALYEGIYGRMPFDGEDVQSYLASVAEGELREPPPGSEAPPWIWLVLRRGLARDPDARYPDMRSLLAALAGPRGEPASAAGGRRWGLGVAVGVGALALALGLAWRFGQVESPTLAASGVTSGLALGGEVAADPGPAAGGGSTTGAVAAEADAGAGATTGSEAAGTSAALAEAATTGPATGGGAGSTGGAREEPARVSPRRRDWCYMDEDRYLLLSRMPRRRTHIRDREGRCHACRVETRPARVARFQPDDCAHYQVCGPAPDEECG